MRLIDANTLLEKVEEFSNRIKESNKYYLVINPSIECLVKSNFESLLDIIKIIFIDLIAFAIFIFIGKLTYLKDILKNTNYILGKRLKSQKCCKNPKNRRHISLS